MLECVLRCSLVIIQIIKEVIDTIYQHKKSDRPGKD